MVFLTAQLWLRSRLTDRYWRVQKVLQHARHFRGRKNRCYKLAVRAVTRAFVKCTKARRLKKRNMRTLWINRITAASQEHGLKYPAFIVNLIKCAAQSTERGTLELAAWDQGRWDPVTVLPMKMKMKRGREAGAV
ncbi:large ribosomal subunit protein bL20m isoform X2 [Canis aureus]